MLPLFTTRHQFIRIQDQSDSIGPNLSRNTERMAREGAGSISKPDNCCVRFRHLGRGKKCVRMFVPEEPAWPRREMRRARREAEEEAAAAAAATRRDAIASFGSFFFRRTVEGC